MPSRQTRRAAGALPRCAARRAEKIQIDLLLPDLPLELRDPALRHRQRVGRRRIDQRRSRVRRDTGTMRRDRQHLRLARPPSAAQRKRPAGAKPLSPPMEILAPNPQLTDQRAHILARKHPIESRQLERAAQRPDRLVRHQFPSNTNRPRD
jgi:hypothetical protein